MWQLEFLANSDDNNALQQTHLTARHGSIHQVTRCSCV
jgi:hypothetical protein